MKSKTIILSAPDGKTNARGIVTLYEDDGLLKCRMRTYSIDRLSKDIKLAIYHQKEVTSANLILKNGVYESSFVGTYDMDLDFYCALIDTDNNNTPILAGGTYSGYYFNDTSVFNASEEEDISTEDITICDAECDKCAHCKYKEYFYANNTPNDNEKDNKEDEVISTPPKEEIPNMLSSITPQFQYIFEHYDADEELNTLLPNSRFVKINENNEQYSIGAIYEEDNLKVICYAVKSSYNTPAPDSIGKHYQWLPVDREDPLSDGYYVVFQDASDLKILKL